MPNLATGQSLNTMMQAQQPQRNLAQGQSLQQMMQAQQPQPNLATGQPGQLAAINAQAAPTQGMPIAAQANPQQNPMPQAMPQQPQPNVPNIFGLRYMNPAMRKQTMQAAQLRWGSPAAQASVRAQQQRDAYVQNLLKQKGLR